MQSKIDPCLQYIMCNGISNYITNETKNSDNNNNNGCDKKTETNERKQKQIGKKQTKEYQKLITHQNRIGWDNLLRGKLSKGWRIMQRGYEMRQKYERNQRRVRLKLTHGHINNPYDNNNAREKKKKKKKKKDPFQELIEAIFNICDDELWNQRNLDRHKPKNKTNYTAVIKTDREIRKLYGYWNEVRAIDTDTLYKVDLETKLKETMHEKSKWIIRWKPAILSSRARAKREGVSNTKPIWKHFGNTTKPKHKVNNDHKRRNNKHKSDLKRQQSIALKAITEVEGFNIVGRNRSTSKQKQSTFCDKKVQMDLPSVISSFYDKKRKEQQKKEEPKDRFGDEWNE